MKEQPTQLLGLTLALLIMFVLTTPLYAGGGAIEISQAKALAGAIPSNSPGCTDAPGFPVTICEPGNYRLTGNLKQADPTTTVIEILADDVTLDLNGFAVFGSGEKGTGRGVLGASVHSPHQKQNRTKVVNGTISGVGHRGIDLGPDSHVENVMVIGSGQDGIRALDGSTVTGNVANRNGHIGLIIVGASGAVTGNTARNNTFTGIATGAGSTVTANTANDNGDDGVAAGDGSTVTGNTVTYNGRGIHTGPGSTVTGNTASDNKGIGILALDGSTVTGNTTRKNGNDGIQTGPSSTVIGNTAVGNTGLGLGLGGGSGYANNVVNTNNGGKANPQVLGGIEMGTNICGGDTICP